MGPYRDPGLLRDFAFLFNYLMPPMAAPQLEAHAHTDLNNIRRVSGPHVPKDSDPTVSPQKT